MGLCWGASFLHKNSVCLFFCFQFFSFVSMLTFNILYICPNKYFIFQVLTYPGGFEILGRLVLLSYQPAHWIFHTIALLTIGPKSPKNIETSQELRMLSSVTINCQITKIVMNSGSQLSEL